MPDDPVRDGDGSDLASEGLDPGVFDRIVLRAESQAEVDGRTAPLLVGMPDVRACLMRPFLQRPDDGVAHPALVFRYDHNLRVLHRNPQPARSQSWNWEVAFFRYLLSLPETPIVKILGVELCQSFERIDRVAPYVALFVQG